MGLQTLYAVGKYVTSAKNNKKKEDEKKNTQTAVNLPANPNSKMNTGIQPINQVTNVPTNVPAGAAQLPTTGLNRTVSDKQSGWAVKMPNIDNKSIDTPLTGSKAPTMDNFRLGSEMKLWNSDGKTVDGATNYGINLQSTGYGSGASGNYGYSGGNSVAAFKPSAAYTKALEYTNQMLEQLKSGRTAYTDKINGVLDAINNRDPFRYDMNADPLFQQSLQSAMQSGKTAMADTMGQAAGLTGGYGSSYATAAANGAYNQYIQQAYDNVADYYQLARGAYDADTNNLYNQLSMYQGLDQDEYNRLANSYGLAYGAAQDMYNQEYNNYWNQVSQNENMRQYDTDMKYKYDALNEDIRRNNESMALKYLDAYGSVDANGNAVTAPEIDSNMYKTALGYYERGGDAAGSEYDNYITYLLGQGYAQSDVDKLDNYARSNGSTPEFYIADIGVKDKKTGKGKTIKDNTYVDNVGRRYSYQQMVDMGYTDEQLKKLAMAK